MNSIKHPSEIQLLVEKNVKRAEYEKLVEEFSDIDFSDFEPHYHDVFTNQTSEHVVEFLINYLMELNLKLIAPHTKTISNSLELRKNFVSYIMGKILKIDELQSLPGYVNWNVFRTEDKKTEQLLDQEEHVEDSDVQILDSSPVVEQQDVDIVDVREEENEEEPTPFANTLDMEDENDEDNEAIHAEADLE